VSDVFILLDSAIELWWESFKVYTADIITRGVFGIIRVEKNQIVDVKVVEMSYKMSKLSKKNVIQFLIFYRLYRFFNELALRCYEIYWKAIEHDK